MSLSKKNLIKPLQTLRLIFMLGIIFSHLGMNFSFAYFSVSGFFVISGFLLTLKYYETDADNFTNPFRFAIGRIKSIYPVYILTILMLLPISIYRIVHHSLALKDYLSTLFVDVFLLQSWFPHIKLAGSINDVSWFLSTIFFLYLLFPFVLRLIKKINKDLVLIGFFVLSAAISIVLLLFIRKMFILPDNLFYFWLIYRFPVFRINDFLAGCVAAVFYEKYLKTAKLNVYVGSLLEVLALAVIPLATYIGRLCGQDQRTVFLSNPVTIFILPATFTVIIFTLEKGILSRIMSLDFLVKCGGLSSDVFLIHYVFIYYIYFLRFDFFFGAFGKPNLLTRVAIIIGSYLTAAIIRAILSVLHKK